MNQSLFFFGEAVSHSAGQKIVYLLRNPTQERPTGL